MFKLYYITVTFFTVTIIFHRIKYEVLGKKLEDICSSINEKKLNEEEELLINIYNKQYLIKKSSIYVKDVNKGSIYSLQNISEMQKLEKDGIMEITEI